jgi:gas vesicle protein
MREDHEYSATMLPFLLGGLVGASLTLLLAPQSGREARYAVGRRVRSGVSAARGVKDRIARRGGELLDRSRRAMPAAAEELREGAEDLAAGARGAAERYDLGRTDRTAL